MKKMTDESILKVADKYLSELYLSLGPSHRTRAIKQFAREFEEKIRKINLPNLRPLSDLIPSKMADKDLPNWVVGFVSFPYERPFILPCSFEVRRNDRVLLLKIPGDSVGVLAFGDRYEEVHIEDYRRLTVNASFLGWLPVPRPEGMRLAWEQ